MCRKKHSEIMRECKPTETLPEEEAQTLMHGVIKIKPVKCVVDGGECNSGRCPKKEKIITKKDIEDLIVKFAEIIFEDGVTTVIEKHKEYAEEIFKDLPDKGEKN